MIRVRRAQDRGHFNHGWLDTWHTFSFADYRDPEHMGFRALRVINEDRVAAGAGFGTHGHRDMEIVTYVLSGQLEHRDSMGNGEVIRPGEVQHMTAGTGVLHSEFNPSAAEPVHLYQIWIRPDRHGHVPGYAQRDFSGVDKRGKFVPLVSPDGAAGSLAIHQDVTLYLADVTPGQPLSFALRPGRHAWVQVVRGNLEVNATSLSASDGAAISDEAELTFTAQAPAEVLLFDLA
jgi:redox-sensitive bicupin YhaK (pirin superfamily)